MNRKKKANLVTITSRRIFRAAMIIGFFHAEECTRKHTRGWPHDNDRSTGPGAGKQWLERIIQEGSAGNDEHVGPADLCICFILWNGIGQFVGFQRMQVEFEDPKWLSPHLESFEDRHECPDHNDMPLLRQR